MPLGQLAPASAAAPGTHATQKPTSQKGFVAVVQSDAFAHSTQRDVVVLQTGVAMFVHCVSVVQPARHIDVCRSQMGAAVPQSEFDVQATHECVAVRQRGVAAGQSVSASHWTHCCEVMSQSFAVAGQSVAVMHPTHAPVVESQSSFLPQAAAAASATQAAWQVWLPG
jgi:hypothetical protein